MKAIDPSLHPQGLHKIESMSVDIFLLPEGCDSITSTRISSPLPSVMSSEERASYHQKLLEEHRFLRVKLEKELPDMPAKAEGAQAAHDFFVNLGIGKIGLRNIRQEDGNLLSEHCLVPFPAYKQFNANPTLHHFGANLGAAMILITQDNQLIIQHRSPANSLCAGIAGATAGGSVDMGKHNSKANMNVLEIATELLLDETKEEIGLSANALQKLRASALALDKKMVHHQVTYDALTSLDSDTIAVNAMDNKHKDTAASFRENIIIFDLTPQIIERLLGEVRNPFSPTHAASLLMLGYKLVIEQNGTEQGDIWLQKTKESMDNNYRMIDKLSLGGRYNPNISATDQDIPSLPVALARVFRPDEYRYIECAFDKAA